METQVTRTASCSCGQLSAQARGEPVRISLCHCLACQRRTGSVFGMQARFPADAVTLAGRSPECGATVFYRLDAVPGMVAIPVGAFADPGFPPPRVSVYEERRHRWVGLPPGIERID